MPIAVDATSPRSAEAGHWGAEVRSDVHVAFEARDSGGVEISLESRVAAYYGSAILEQTREVLDELGVKHARVAIHDEGALPFVIAARIEAAAERAGIALGKHSLPEQHPLPAPSPKDRLRRSRLYLPGSEPKYYINASSARAGCGDRRGLRSTVQLPHPARSAGFVFESAARILSQRQMRFQRSGSGNLCKAGVVAKLSVPKHVRTV